MLAQIKHSISITESDTVFGEVIQAAWNDFNNLDGFSKKKDVIALITGPLSTTDVNDVRPILEWARSSADSGEFINKVNLTRFSSRGKQTKLQAFRAHLNNANGGNPVTDDVLFEFLKHFHILGYDLDAKAGSTLSLLHSLIGQYSQNNVQDLWSRLVDEVQSVNKNAGTITRESLPEDLQDIFKQRDAETIPAEYALDQNSDWNNHEYAPELAIASILGSWDENNESDRKIICQLVQDYPIWIGKIREILQLPDSPVSLKNGKWSIKKRKALWELLGTRIFDNDLNSFKECAIAILSERDPQFELPANERYAANIYGKVFLYSPNLRKGMAESLALLGSEPEVLINCTQSEPKTIATLSVRDILNTSDWVLWGSLNNLLPVLAEAAPGEFLSAVESALRESPCPFNKLFSEEGHGITGRNYLTGLLWALELLAWEQIYLVRACVILGGLASRDPGGNWANRPANSLATILLPWLPQTTASIAKRKVAVETLVAEYPSVAWQLLLSLLPSQHQTSMGTYKPSWRTTIPDNWKDNVTQEEYLEQISIYAELAVSIANDDIKKLSELVDHLNRFPKPAFENILATLSSDAIIKKPEEERLELWENLTYFSTKHRRFSGAKWALDVADVFKIELIAQKLAPQNPLNLYRTLFSGHDSKLYEKKGNWEEQRKRIENRRSKAIKYILNDGGIDAVVQFAESAESPGNVGNSLGVVADTANDAALLPAFLVTDNERLKRFIGAYIWSRHRCLGWSWADGLDRSSWSALQIACFLNYLPFADEAWSRAIDWLGESEIEYWSRANGLPHNTSGDISGAIDKLLEHGRPEVAINCLYQMLNAKRPLDKSQSVKALLDAASSKETSSEIDTYVIEEIIKALQEDPHTDPDDLFRVEWAYLPLLTYYGSYGEETSPKFLQNRLASNPEFFCEIIQLLYRSNNDKKPRQEPSENEKNIATSAQELLYAWRLPPGIQDGDSFSQEKFREWLQTVKYICSESGHLAISLQHVGRVLVHSPADPQGLWIDHGVAEAFNATDAEDMRRGFFIGAKDSCEAHIVDPTGQPDRKLADQYREKANEVENAGYHRFAITLRELAELTFPPKR